MLRVLWFTGSVNNPVENLFVKLGKEGKKEKPLLSPSPAKLAGFTLVTSFLVFVSYI